jgi:WD repeat-containing protein 23
MGSSSPTSPVDWRAKRYILTCIPKRAGRTFVDDAAQLINTTATAITTPFTRLFSPTSPRNAVTADEVAEGDIDLREDETLDIDRAPHEEQDDSPDPLRVVKLVELFGKEDENDQRLSDKARIRRQWEVIPILKEKTRTL